MVYNGNNNHIESLLNSKSKQFNLITSESRKAMYELIDLAGIVHRGKSQIIAKFIIFAIKF